MLDPHQGPECNAWNPGLESKIPTSLYPLITLYKSENVSVSYEQAKEISDFCGLNTLDVVAFRVERLIIHELLVRVTADLAVPDGPNYEDLGISLRSMVATIYDKYVLAEIDQVEAAFEDGKSTARNYINEQLSLQIFNREPATPVKPESSSLITRLFNRFKSDSKVAIKRLEPVEIIALEHWREMLKSAPTPLQKSYLAVLIKVVGGITGHRGKLIPDQALVTKIAVSQVCNEQSAELLGDVIEPIFNKAVAAEKYRVLAPQSEPVIMNVKGASASGKSTIRPQQRQLASKLNIPWEDFALISPDYWRKYLLDYDALGEHSKYGAMLTGQELAIIDRKLDRYMTLKAAKGQLSHLLIDRFRFDSFSQVYMKTADSRLLSRFGDRVFLFFMITSPAETVARAWSRGLTTGRFKAVDDLLYHNVEAFTGMPSLFLSWVKSEDKEVHFEFLDNDVDKGSLPRTAAFGWNNSMTILDINMMNNIDRYRKVNINADNPEEIFSPSDLDADKNTEFLSQCIQDIAEIAFIDKDTAHIYLHIQGGKLIYWDQQYIAKRQDNQALQSVLGLLDYAGDACPIDSMDDSALIDTVKEKNFTVGHWMDLV